VVLAACVALVGKGEAIIRGNVRISISSAVAPGTVSLLSLRVEGQVTDRVLPPAVAGDHVLVMSNCTVAHTGNGAAMAISGTAASTHYLTNCRIDTTVVAGLAADTDALTCETGTATLTKCQFGVRATAAGISTAVITLSSDARMDDCTVSLVAVVTDLGALSNVYLCKLLGAGKVCTIQGCMFNFTAEAPIGSIGGPLYGASVQSTTTAYFVRNVFNLQNTSTLTGGAVLNGGTAYTHGNVALTGSLSGFVGTPATPLATI
jgi:hypothetical protein